MSKILVAYFSASGRTKLVAEMLANVCKGDLFEIEPSIPYTDADLDWMDKSSRSSLEMKDKSSRPEILKKVNNMNDYSTVYLGFPIWWGVAPTIINTFLESYDFSGKKIITFATSGGSGMGNSTSELKVSAPNAKFIDGSILELDNIEKFVNNTN